VDRGRERTWNTQRGRTTKKGCQNPMGDHRGKKGYKKNKKKKNLQYGTPTLSQGPRTTTVREKKKKDEKKEVGLQENQTLGQKKKKERNIS